MNNDYNAAPQGQGYQQQGQGQNEQPRQGREGYYTPPYLPNSVLNFFLSLIPGAGQMYQGLMLRGVLMMALFAGAITLTSVCHNFHYGLGALLIGLGITAIVIVYFFSFFDSLRTCRLIRNGAWTGDREQDALLQIPSVKLNDARQGRKVLGIILVVIGALGMCSYIIDAFIGYEWFEYYLRPALDVLLPLAFLVAGIILIAKSGRRKPEAM